jgi:hypothetical protein
MMPRLLSLIVLLAALPGCVGKRIEAPKPVLSLGSANAATPYAHIHNYAHWFGRCENTSPFRESDSIECDRQRFKLTVACDGVPCITEPAGLLTGGAEIDGDTGLFVVRPQTSGVLTFLATMTHLESGETLSATSTSVVRDPERLELTCSYTDFDVTVEPQACPTTTGVYGANGFFSFAVVGLLGEERLGVEATWTMSGFNHHEEAGGLVDRESLVLYPSGRGTHSVRVTYGALSAEYAVLLK